MKTIEANGRINREGRLVINNADRPVFINEISKHPGKSVMVKVCLDGKKRSGEQNNYYYGVVVSLIQSAITEEWGEPMTKDDVHELLKQQCNWIEKTSTVTGESVKVARSTANLSTVEFEEYLERCRRFAVEFLNLVIPLPNEQIELNF